MNYILDMREQVVVMLIWSYQKKKNCYCIVKKPFHTVINLWEKRLARINHFIMGIK